MKYKRSLRSRIIFAFASFGVVLSLTLALLLYAGFQKIEEVVLLDTMKTELARHRTADNQMPNLVSESRTMTTYVTSRGQTSDIPGYLQSLDPGKHRISIDGQQYMVFVEDDAQQRYFVRYDETQIVQRERYWINALFVSIALALGISVWAGFTLSRHVIRPVTRLAEDVHALESGDATGDELEGYWQDEVGALAEQFRKYREKFQTLLEREREFASNVSHELRTPVTSINLAVEVLASDSTMSGRQLEKLQRVRRAGREMSEMVNTFLHLSREEHNVEVAECDVNRIAREVFEDQSVWLGDKPVVMEFIEEAALTVQAPPGVLAVLIGNIVRNAFRFTKEGSVQIRICSDRVVVEDTGPGIDPATRERLFERHVHGTEADHGTGLGLAIVKRLCERYGWEVRVSPRNDKGTRFELIMKHP